ncbi:hypothetical protein ENBRE01_3527, partial [Enteropsectra breve]
IIALIDAKIPLKKSLATGYSIINGEKISARYNKTGCVDKIKGFGRPRLLADDNIAIIIDLIRQNSSFSLRKMAGKIKLK